MKTFLPHVGFVSAIWWSPLKKLQYFRGRRGRIASIKSKYCIGTSEIQNYIHCLANMKRMRWGEQLAWKPNKAVLISFWIHLSWCVLILTRCKGSLMWLWGYLREFGVCWSEEQRQCPWHLCGSWRLSLQFCVHPEVFHFNSLPKTFWHCME